MDKKTLLLGKTVTVVNSPNRSQIGLEGTVIYESIKKNGYVVLLTKKGCKLVEKGIVNLKNRLLNLEYRNTKLKSSSCRITVLNE